MSHSIPNIIIIAAGRGSRLAPLTNTLPKGLVEVNGRPILYYQLRALKMCGINSITMVIGYHGEIFKEYIANEFPDISAKFIFNDMYMNYSGDAYSSYLARGACGEACLQINSDILFHPQVLTRVLTFGKSSICLKRKWCESDDMKVYIRGNQVARISKEIPNNGAVGEAMGIYYFGGDFLKLFTAELEATFAQRSLSPKVNKSNIIEKLIARGNSFYYIDVTQYPIIDINDPRDLVMAEKEIIPQIKFIQR